MKQENSLIYTIFTLLIFFIFLKVFWPLIFIIPIVIMIYIIYIKYKLKKNLKESSNQINEKYGFSDWSNQAEDIKQKEVIDVEYTERKEEK
ncbi:MAG: hypothetical protein GX675_05955 [Erysipelotrichaceae bacterium]|nr:hypothetical protein [Erysipelotrichaceae bacterium]